MAFDVTDHLHELRRRETAWLVARRADLVREQRRLRVEELAVVAVLDERGVLDESLAERDGVCDRTVRETLETARALEGLPAVAAAAHAGELSGEQLGSVVTLADGSSDAEWAERGANTPPAVLARMVRCQSTPTVEESRARREARHLRMWWDTDHAMLNLRGALPDLMGARFEATINSMIEQMRPAKGQAWDTRDHRSADALVALCEARSADAGPDTDTVAPAARAERAARRASNAPTAAAKPLLVVHVPLRGPATIAGIPLADALVEQLRANAWIEPVLVDDDGVPLVVGRRSTAISAKLARAILLRDGHCRVGCCELRHGLELHHLVPRSWGGTDDPSNLATVCTPAGHHPMLIPHGPWALVGNPNRPDGLHLVRYTDLTDTEARNYGLPPPGPSP